MTPMPKLNPKDSYALQDKGEHVFVTQATELKTDPSPSVARFWTGAYLLGTPWPWQERYNALTRQEMAKLVASERKQSAKRVNSRAIKEDADA